MVQNTDPLLYAYAVLERFKQQQQPSQQPQQRWMHLPGLNLPSNTQLAHAADSAIPLGIADGRPRQLPSLSTAVHVTDPPSQRLEPTIPTPSTSSLRPATGSAPSGDDMSLFSAHGDAWPSPRVAMGISSRGPGVAARQGPSSPASHTQAMGARNGYGSRRSTREHADDSNTLSMVRASRMKPKVEGVCFDKYFKRWVAKKSGTKKIYFPVHKHGFDSAYELAVETRRRHLQATKGNDGATGELALPSAPLGSLQNASDNSLKAVGSPRRRATSLLVEGETRSSDSKHPSADINCDDLQAIKDDMLRKEDSDDQMDSLQEFGSGPQNGPNLARNTVDLPTDRLEADEYDTEGRVNGHRSEGPADTVAKSSGQMQNKVDSGAQPPGSVTTDAVHRVTNPKEEDHEGDEEELLRGGASGLGSTTGQGDNSNWACARTQNQNPCSAASLGPPTVSEALKRLRLTCFKEMAGRMPVNPELAPKEAIRVAEALVPYPTGIRFDKSTFRWFALFRESGTGGKRAKTFTAKMFGGCVLRAYEGCLQFCLARCSKTSEGNKDSLSYAGPAEESRHVVFRPSDEGGVIEGRGFGEETKEDLDELKRLTPQELLDRAHALPRSSDIFFHKRRHHWAAFVAGQSRTFPIRQHGLKGGYKKAIEFKKHVLEAKRRGILASNKDVDMDDPDSLGNETYACSGIGPTEGSSQAIISNEREDHTDFGEAKHDTLDITVRFRDEALRRRSQRVSGVKRRRVHPENLLNGDATPSCPMSTTERSMWEAGSHYAKLDCSPCSFLQPHGSCSCVMPGQNTGCAGVECPTGHGFPVPFCLRCLEPSTRQLLHRVVLLCFDQLEAALLERLRCSSEDKWLRWLSVRLHKDRFSKPAVRQIVDSSAPGEAFSLDIKQWEELLPYVQLFWPFIEQQEVPASLDLCVVAELLQQLHTIAAKNPEHFPEYPVATEIQRVSGTLAGLTPKH